MTQKPHLILWGGSWEPLKEPLSPETIDSHAKVSYFFLKEALSQYFDVTGLDEFEKMKNVETELRENTVGVLSTFQAGFTQLRDKKPEIYQKIAKLLRHKKFSIIDETTRRRTCEDILFTVIPPDYSIKNRIQNFISPSRGHHMGWCASPAYCHPEPNDIFTIFLDHGHYAGEDYTHLFIEALSQIDLDFQVFMQGNNGVEKIDLSKGWQAESYERANKVPWADMMAYYRRADLFCLTHKESAGLSSIEAAMGGAGLIVPIIRTSIFLHPGLLKEPLDFTVVDCNVPMLKAALEHKIKTGIDKKCNHERIAHYASWDQAARRIQKVLERLG